MSQQPPGWYRDARGDTRWWDGSKWTEQTATTPSSQVSRAPAVPQTPAPAPKPAPKPAAPPPARPVPVVTPVEAPASPWALTPEAAAGTTPKEARRGPGLVVGLLAAAVVVATAVFAILILTKAAHVYSAKKPTKGSSAAATTTSTDKVNVGYPSTAYVAKAPKAAAKAAYCKLAKTDTAPMNPVQYAMWNWDQVDIGTPDDMPAYVRKDWEKQMTALYRKDIYTSDAVYDYVDGACGSD